MDMPDSPIHFQATVFPHRSLSRQGFIAVMTVVIAMNLVVSGICLVRGAWPVLAFAALETLLLAVAFRISYRSAQVSETLWLTDNALIVNRRDVGKPERTWTFQPYWLRVVMDDSPDGESPLILTSHGRSLVIGAFLAPQQRADLARSLRDALRRLREAPLP